MIKCKLLVTFVILSSRQPLFKQRDTGYRNNCELSELSSKLIVKSFRFSRKWDSIPFIFFWIFFHFYFEL